MEGFFHELPSVQVFCAWLLGNSANRGLRRALNCLNLNLAFLWAEISDGTNFVFC